MLPTVFGAVPFGNDGGQRLEMICHCQTGADFPDRRTNAFSQSSAGIAHCGEVEIRATPGTRYRLTIESNMPRIEGKLIVYGGDNCSPQVDSTNTIGAILHTPESGITRLEIGGELITGAVASGNYEGTYHITAESL